MNEILLIQDITKKFNQQETVLKGVSLSFYANTFNVILGQSGSGKSTLINIMSYLMKPTTGHVYHKGIDIATASKKELLALRNDKFSNIFQDYLLLPDLTVQENIELGNVKNRKGIGYQELVEKLGIQMFDKSFPHELSGGQRQRVSIARAMIKKPDILFCDEATGALDEENSINVVDYLKEINRKYGTTIIFSTHNIKISKIADRVITMKDGSIISDMSNLNPLSVKEVDWGINL